MTRAAPVFQLRGKGRKHKRAQPTAGTALPDNRGAAREPARPALGTHGEVEDEADKVARLGAAEAEVQALVDAGHTTGAIERHFPALTEKYGLTRIEIVGLGTPAAAIEVQVNPTAEIKFAGGNVWTLCDGQIAGKQDVVFNTGTSPLGDTWGLEMIARQLGPHHPQGYGPRGQKNLMRPLPTNPKDFPDTSERYIRGHLLNDNLGGPGKPENMFPITASANSTHHNQVEAYVKEWVNNQGKFVHYHVQVVPTNIHLPNPGAVGDPANYINAEFRCEAYAIDTAGKRANNGDYVHKTIRSHYTGHPSSIGSGGYSDLGTTTPQGFAPVDKSYSKLAETGKVEVSKTKGKKRAAPVWRHLPDAFREAVVEMADELTLLGLSGARLNGYISRIADHIEGVTGPSLAVLIDAEIFNNQAKLAQFFPTSGPWNTYITRIEAGEAAAIAYMEEITDTVHILLDLKKDKVETQAMMAIYEVRNDSFLVPSLLHDPAKARARYQSVRAGLTKRALEEASMGRVDHDLASTNTAYGIGAGMYAKWATSVVERGEKIGKDKGPSAGGLGLGLLGAWGGAKIGASWGASLGSVFGISGTVIGGAAGALLGGAIGGAVGYFGGKKYGARVGKAAAVNLIEARQWNKRRQRKKGR